MRQRRVSNFCLTVAQRTMPNPRPPTLANDRQAAAKIQAIKRGQMDRADVAMKRSATNGPLQMLQACTAPLQKCTAGIRAMIEGVQDGSSAIFGQSQAVSAHGAHLSEQDLPHPHPKGQSELPPALEAQLRKLFSKMDSGRDQILSKAEAVEYWGKNFAKINAQAMFNEVTPAVVSAVKCSIATGRAQGIERRPRPRRHPCLNPRATHAATLRDPGGRQRQRHHLHRRVA